MNTIIKSIQTNSEILDVNKVFKHYKYAIPEHEPIKLSNNLWLHTYRLTKHDIWDNIFGEEDDLNPIT